MNNDKLPYSIVRQAASELLVRVVLMALHKAASMLASDCDISHAEANSILVEKLVQFTTKHPSRMINPDVGAIYFRVDTSASDDNNFTLAA